MQEETQGNVIQSSTNYDQFTLMGNNREQNRGHVEAIKTAFQEIGNLTRVQPILVNERYEIIDGQHRFVAAKELNEPIYYTVTNGLGIDDARAMNILHRSWHIEDFAQSYADSGNRHYQKYLQLKEDYGFSHSTMITYINGEELRGAFANFRKGLFFIPDEAAARQRLDKLAAVVPHVEVGRDKYFTYAMLKAMAVEGYDNRRMINKLDRIGDQFMRRFASISDYLRALEEIYNHKNSESNRLRLY